MLIEFHESLREQLDDGARDRERTIDALENIANVRREGKHVLFSDRATIRYLFQHRALSERTRAVFRHVAEKLPEMRSFAQSVQTRIEVVSNAVPSLSARAEGTRRVVRVPVRWFSESLLSQRALLLAENLVDAKCYVRIAKTYASLNGHAHIPVSADLLGGGGSTTGPLYDHFQRTRERLCLCVVDSDQKAPGGRIGSTARGVSVADDPNEPLTDWLMLHVRELENAIPTAIYSEVSAGDRSRMEMVAFLERLEREPDPEARQFLDFKRGLNYKEVLAFPAGSPEERFWGSAVPMLRRAGASIHPSCSATGACATPTGCTCTVTPSLGDSVLDAVAEKLEEKTPIKIAQRLCPHTLPEWLRVGEVVFAWCCGSPRLSAT